MSAGNRLLVGVAAALVLAAVVVGGILFVRDEDPPTDYDAQIEDDFMATCTADADALGFNRSEDFCGCAFNRIRSEIPYDRFLEIDVALQADPDAVPRPVERIRTECYIEIEASGHSLTTATTVPS